jgi:hypothetical protein
MIVISFACHCPLPSYPVPHDRCPKTCHVPVAPPPLHYGTTQAHQAPTHALLLPVASRLSVGCQVARLPATNAYACATPVQATRRLPCASVPAIRLTIAALPHHHHHPLRVVQNLLFSFLLRRAPSACMPANHQLTPPSAVPCAIFTQTHPLPKFLHPTVYRVLSLADEAQSRRRPCASQSCAHAPNTCCPDSAFASSRPRYSDMTLCRRT